ncbi:MAG: PDZ domain-containing protein [Pirellulales bacterium]
MLKMNRITVWSALFVVVGGTAVADEPAGQALPQPNAKWVGAMCVPLEGALRSQLRLPEGQGLLVMDVVADSPAAKAGLQRHDVLLKAADQPLADVPSLSKVVAVGEKFSLQLLRGGQKTTLDVEPADRPEGQFSADTPLVRDIQSRPLRDWLEQFDGRSALTWPPTITAAPEGQRRFKLRFFHPGQALGQAEQRKWPGDLSIGISRQGGEALKITVEQGEEKWEIGREELGELPAKLRPFVERMLSGGSNASIPVPDFQRDLEIELPDVDFSELSEPGDLNITPPLPLPRNLDKDIRKQLEDLNRRLQELQNQLSEPAADRDVSAAEK